MRRMFIWSKIGTKSVKDISQDICKDKESNLRPSCWLLRLKLSRGKFFLTCVRDDAHAAKNLNKLSIGSSH